MAEVVIPEIKHEYIRQVDTETTKNDWFDECIADNKEAAWAGIGTGEIDSQYQPSPVKEPDYYMQYCSSDDYDYLKDYRLIWGYGIGIIEQDVICSLSTGEHLAEGKDACDTYATENAAGENTDWKRGTWIKFSGNRNVSPTRIGEVVLPERVISLKDLCVALTFNSTNCEIEGFNTENIINMDNMFYNKTVASYDNLNIYGEYNLSNVKSIDSAFRFCNVKNCNFNNVPNIEYKNTFRRSHLNSIPIGIENVGGKYMYADASFDEAINSVYILLYSYMFAKVDVSSVSAIDFNNCIISCTSDISYCFDNRTLIDIPNINYDNCKNASYCFNGKTYEYLTINLDFSRLIENIDLTDFIIIRYCVLNITAGENSIICSTNYRRCFTLYSNNIINITNILKFNQVNKYLFFILGINNNIIGEINGVNLLYFNYNTNDKLLGDNTNLILSNDIIIDKIDNDYIRKCIIIINQTVSTYSPIFNLSKIDFNKCRSIGIYINNKYTYNKNYATNNDTIIISNSIYDDVYINCYIPFNIEINNVNVHLYNIYNNIDATSIITINNGNCYTTRKCKLSGLKLYINNGDYCINEEGSYQFDVNDSNLNTVDIYAVNNIIIDDDIIYYDSSNNKMLADIINLYDINGTITYKGYNTNRFFGYLYLKCHTLKSISILDKSVSNFYPNYNFIFVYFEDTDNIGLSIPNYTKENNNDIDFYLSQVVNNLPINIFLKTITYYYGIKKYYNTHKYNNIIYEDNDTIYDLVLDSQLGMYANVRLYGDCNRLRYNIFSNNIAIDTNGMVINGQLNDDDEIQTIINDDLTFSQYLYVKYIANENLNITIKPTLTTSSFYNNVIYIQSPIKNITLNLEYNLTAIYFEVYYNSIISIIINNNGYKMPNNTNFSLLANLIQESINSIVNPSNYQSGATLTINTTPFQYITEEQKQALTDAGVTLVEYIPTETTE